MSYFIQHIYIIDLIRGQNLCFLTTNLVGKNCQQDSNYYEYITNTRVFVTILLSIYSIVNRRLSPTSIYNFNVTHSCLQRVCKKCPLQRKYSSIAERANYYTSEKLAELNILTAEQFTTFFRPNKYNPSGFFVRWVTINNCNHMERVMSLFQMANGCRQII